MKTSKDALNSKEAHKNFRESTLLFIILLVVSLLIASLPALSFGEDGFGSFAGTPTPANTGATYGVAPAAPPGPAPSANTLPISPNPIPPATVPAAPAASAPPVRNAMGVADQRPTLSVDPTKPRIGRQPTLQQTIAQQTTIQKLLEPTQQMLRDRPDLLRSVVSENHPFYNYYNLPEPPKNPNEPKSAIEGKPFTVAQLLEGVWGPNQREALLEAYWELAGSLVEYNIRFNAERQIQNWYFEAKSSGNAQRADEFFGAFHIAQQQRRATEFTFLKKQTQLVEQLQSIRGSANLKPEEYPIPCDYPSAKKYVTYAETLARTPRAKLLSRLIPFQEQLIDARKNERAAAERFFQATLKNRQGSVQDWVSVLNQRTGAFVELTGAVVDYNKMIAEYTSETIGSNISTYRMVGALIELPKFEGGTPDVPNSTKPPVATSQMNTFSDNGPPPGPHGRPGHHPGPQGPPAPPTTTFATEPNMLTQAPPSEQPFQLPAPTMTPAMPSPTVADAPQSNPFAATGQPIPTSEPANAAGAIQPAGFLDLK